MLLTILIFWARSLGSFVVKRLGLEFVPVRSSRSEAVIWQTVQPGRERCSSTLIPYIWRTKSVNFLFCSSGTMSASFASFHTDWYKLMLMSVKDIAIASVFWLHGHHVSSRAFMYYQDYRPDFSLTNTSCWLNVLWGAICQHCLSQNYSVWCPGTMLLQLQRYFCIVASESVYYSSSGIHREMAHMKTKRSILVVHAVRHLTHNWWYSCTIPFMN